MAEVRLVASTGDPWMDKLVHDVVDGFLSALPNRLRAVYVLGSYADETALPTSDLDLVLITADRLRYGEQGRIAALCATWASQASGELDIEVEEEAALRAGISPTLKLGSRLLWGEPIVQRLELVPLTRWTRDRMHSSYWRLAGLFSRPMPLSIPLEYPDPSDEFFGYARRLTRLPNGQQAPGTRDLMRAVGWMATALLAYQARQYVPTKRQCSSLYREYIGDEWATLLDDMTKWVRSAWEYCLPDAPEDRIRLQTICARTLGFENHFLRLYRCYALAELLGNDPEGRQLAQEAFERIHLEDADIRSAITVKK